MWARSTRHGVGMPSNRARVTCRGASKPGRVGAAHPSPCGYVEQPGAGHLSRRERAVRFWHSASVPARVRRAVPARPVDCGARVRTVAVRRTPGPTTLGQGRRRDARRANDPWSGTPVGRLWRGRREGLSIGPTTLGQGRRTLDRGRPTGQRPWVGAGGTPGAGTPGRAEYRANDPWSGTPEGGGASPGRVPRRSIRSLHTPRSIFLLMLSRGRC
jgi:hypothetical protein